MSFIILSSVALRLLALGWALVLLARLRDWRMAFLAAMLALMALRQTMTGLQGFDRELLVFTAQLEELPGLIVSVLAFLAVFYVGRLVEEQQGEKAALRRSRDDLREVLDALPALVGYVDKDQRYQFVNKAYEHWQRRPRGEILRRSVEEVMGEANYGVVRGYIERALAGDPVTYSTSVQFPGRGERFVEVNYVPHQGEEAKGIEGFFVLVNDLTEHKGAEDAVRESEALLRRAAEVAKLGYWEWSSETGRITKYSEEAARIIGRPVQELLISDEDFLRYVHPEDRDRFTRTMQASDARFEPYDMEYRVVRDDGEVRFVRESAVYLAEDDDKRFRVIGTLQDITERKQAEEELRQSEERFRDYAEVASDWYWETDAQLRFTFVSPRLKQIAGLDPQEYIGRSRREISGVGVDAAVWDEHLRDLDERRPFRDFVYAWRLPDGRPLHFRISGKPIFDKAGAFKGYRGVGSNLTRQVEAEAERRQSEIRLARAIEAVPAAFALFDPEDRLVLCNKEYRDIYETASAPMVPGARFEDFVRAFARQGGIDGAESDPDEWVARRLDRRRGPARALEYKRADDQWTEVSDYILDDGSIITIGISITERKRAEEARRRHEAALAQLLRRNTMGEMAAAMAHELNQPLAAVVNFSGGCLRRMRSGKTQGDDLLEAMQQICDQSQRASEVLRRIGGFVGQTQSERAPVDPRGVLETVAALMDPELRANQVKAEFRVPDETPLVLATSIEIEQVLLNLAKNAIEAMLELPDAERELTVELSCSDPEIIEIAVSDRGEGFAEGAELRPFDPFFTTKPGGLGMGLAISRTIVEAHGGRIWTESNPRGGATVRLTLPTLEEMRQDAA